MYKFIFSMLFVVALALPTPSHAVGDECDFDDPTTRAVVDLSADEGEDGVQTCSTDALGMSYTFKAIGLCKGFPNLATGLANCQTVFDRNVPVDLTASGGGQPDIAGQIPDADSYDYIFALTDKTFKVKGQVEFTEEYIGSTGSSFNRGSYCTPRNVTFRTSVTTTVDFDIPATQILSEVPALVPFTCSNTDQTGNEGEATFVIDNVGLAEFSARLNIEGYVWEPGSTDPDSDVNVILLNAGRSVAANANDVSSVLFVKNRTTDEVVVGDDITEMDIEFSTENAFQIYYYCDPALLNTALSVVNPSLAADCAILAPSLGEGAFTPVISVD